MTHADIPEIAWDYEAKVGALKLAWWLFLGALTWVVVWSIIALVS